ncbi:MAG TPA: penicillin-binding transpeptidase domain-containing protein [Acidobacteriota bacterium]|nr:penicillin-binding transpeptidase domain-containing protein [Acidobacteriota bacterium]
MYSQTYPTRRVSPGLLRTRFQFALLCCLVWVGAIALRLVFVQVLRHDAYVARANRQRQSVVALDPERGPILDSKNRQMAISIASESVYAMLEEMENPERALQAVASVISVDPDEILERNKGKSFAWVARKIPQDKAEQLRKMQIPGIYFTTESRRYYPNKDLAAHVLGFVGLDNKGLSGVEYQYDSIITGVPGKLFALRDAKRRLLMPSGSSSVVTPTIGRTLQLTIDSSIQHIAESELAAGIQEEGAKGGSVIIMNPYTGEILALANAPTFNPNAFSQVVAKQWKNRAIQDYYEPGSTFKPVVAAAALDLGLVRPEEEFDCQWGAITLAGGHILKDHKAFGTLTFQQIIEKSSNVGMIKVGMKVGPQSLYHFAGMFGFGQKTGVDLPGESSGIVRSVDKWSAISIGAVSIGQEIGVTPIQVLRMMTAIANGGSLVTPHLVARISDSSGEMKPTVFAQPQPLPLKHDTLEILRTFLEGVVSPEGSGSLAQIPGYRVAGKTGTAQRIGPSGTYADGGYIASFVGFAPVENPAFSMIVILDGPKKEYYGGRVAAPLFRKIGQQVLKSLDIPPDQKMQNPALNAESAFPRGSEADYPEGIEPAAYTPPPEQHHKPVPATDDGKADGLVMPSLFGRTAREAIELLSRKGLPFRILGTGAVVRQWPVPGAPLTKDDLIILTLDTHPQRVLATGTDPNDTRK